MKRALLVFAGGTLLVLAGDPFLRKFVRNQVYGRTLTFADEAPAESLRANRELLEPRYEAAFPSCINIIQDGIWEDKRDNCLGRVLVRRFEPMISNDESLRPDSPEISRLRGGKCRPWGAVPGGCSDRTAPSATIRS